MKNLNDLAQEVAFREGKKISLPIGQVKEVLKIVRELFKEYPIHMLRLLVK